MPAALLELADLVIELAGAVVGFDQQRIVSGQVGDARFHLENDGNGIIVLTAIVRLGRRLKK